MTLLNEFYFLRQYNETHCFVKETERLQSHKSKNTISMILLALTTLKIKICLQI